METIPPPIQSLLDLFTEAFEGVRFGDIDGKSLSAEATEVVAAAAVVHEAEAALEQAREILNTRQEALLCQAQRALAYAKVYAEADEVLSARVATIALARPARRARANGETLVLSADPDPAPRKRGRPRKVVPEASLPMNAELMT